MNDVLPKPFTKEGLLTMLDKHLGHLKKDATGAASVPQSAIRPPMKEETSPNKSSPSSTWHSPSGLTGASPSSHSVSDEYMQALRSNGTYSLDGSVQSDNVNFHSPTSNLNPSRGGSQRRQVSDMSAPEDIGNELKRQRMYAPQHVPQMAYSKR